jgi:transcriptional regulator with XRE-family HTH domain
MGDAKQKARAEVRRAQSNFERAQSQRERASVTRRESFERARAAGLSLSEIAEAAKLHRSRIDQILHGK